MFISATAGGMAQATSEAATGPNVVVLGGTGAVSEAVRAHLEGCTSGVVERAWGANRYATATAASQAVFPSTVGTVYVGTGENFPDAVAAGSAAAGDGAPILLTQGTALPAATKTELARLDPTTIYILGGEGAVSGSVAAQLGAYGATTRLSGSSRYGTAAAISGAKFPTADTVYVATGADFPDALAGAPAAASDHAPILLVTKDSVPTPTAQELARLKPSTTYILGGSAVVSSAVAAQLPGTVVRLAGANRYATAVEISKAKFAPGVPVIYVATGTNFPDALAGGALAGYEGGPILLVTKYAVPSVTATEIARLTGMSCSSFSFTPTTFGSGTWTVGSQVPAGTYRTAGGPGCYAARLSGFGGTIDDIIANEYTSGSVPLTVTIEPTDAGFESDADCGTWTNEIQFRLPPTTAPFGNGTWFVGEEVAPGTWRNSDSSAGCYWERRSGFSWQLADTIANGFSTSAIQTVTIEGSDEGFYSKNCGTWTKIG